MDPVDEIAERHPKATRERNERGEAWIAFGALEQADGGAMQVAHLGEPFL